jgi:acyl-CoA synthetase (AMP-forming)/AMP-acid ligase II
MSEASASQCPKSPWAVRLDVLAAQFDQRPAVTSRGRGLSFRGLAGWARAVAAALREAGASGGDPVAVLARNGPAVVAASYGTLAAGAAEFILDPRLGPDDIAYAVRLLGIRLAVAEAAQASRLSDLGVEVIVVDNLEARDTWSPLLQGGCEGGSQWGKIVLTSGTTGRPKAIVHSDTGRWHAHVLLRAHLPFRPGPGDCILLMTPYGHGAGLLTAAFLDYGASVELIDGVDTAHAKQVLGDGRANAVFAPPTVLAKLVSDLGPAPIRGVRTVFCGTATLQPALYRAAAALFGPVIRVTYGKSEMFNPICVLEAGDAEAYYLEAERHEGVCLGVPASGVEVVLRDADGRVCRPGKQGEIHLWSQHMMIGHVDQGGFHRLAPGAFHATGDFGYMDEHSRLFLSGRAQDVIKTGGYKIYPEEIERLLDGEVAVIGIASQHWGEIVVAVAARSAVPDDWAQAAEAAVAGLARYKQPRAYLTLEELPRSAQGKVQRAKVREAVLECYGLRDGPYPTFEVRRAD